MKRRLVVSALLATSLVSASASNQIENGRGFEHLTYPPTNEWCLEKMQTELGAQALEALRIDNDLMIQRNPPTTRENNAKVLLGETDDLPDLTETGNQAPVIGEFFLPKIGLEIIVRSEHPWQLNPEALEGDIEAVLTYFDNDIEPEVPMQDIAYGCYHEDLFDRGAIYGERLEIIILGQGEKCITGDSIGERGVNSCPTSGRIKTGYSPIRAYLAPRESEKGVEWSASSILMHEIFHFITKKLGIQHPNRKKWEFAAYKAQDVAKVILNPDDLPLTLEKPDPELILIPAA